MNEGRFARRNRTLGARYQFPGGSLRSMTKPEAPWGEVPVSRCQFPVNDQTPSTNDHSRGNDQASSTNDHSRGNDQASSTNDRSSAKGSGFWGSGVRGFRSDTMAKSQAPMTSQAPKKAGPGVQGSRGSGHLPGHLRSSVVHTAGGFKGSGVRGFESENLRYLRNLRFV